MMKFLFLIAIPILCTAADPAKLLEENRLLAEEVRELEKRWSDQANANRLRQRERQNYEQVIQRQRALLTQPDSGPVAMPEAKEKIASVRIPLSRPNQPFASLENGVLTIDSPEPSTQPPLVLTGLDPERYAGKKVTFRAEVKAENLSAPAQHHLGGKFGLRLVDHDGKTTWPAAQIGGGSFDWKQISFTTEIPYGARRIALMLGMQGVTGRISFRAIEALFVE